ncbi:LANO_0F10814g1_1 [Lachancea nothofagi CBS 11611]|uniref:LANO_0F10814g1_1 n=1 Tax=Lachancea nothofagi CBS 11611 TaxID=1266666 RepID=A0A1G4KAK6_9SACH|nr:LANO_0F10814g1_1 [Lachancea nothofagi CBS 11611]
MTELEAYVPMIDAILSVSNPDEISAKRIRKAIQELFAVELESQRKKVNALIIERFNELQDSRSKITPEELVEKDAAIARKLSKKINGTEKRSKKGSKDAKPKKKRKVSESGNALSQNKMLLSPELQELVKEPEMARTQVVKKVWEHIREHNLQNPSDRREILCDETMKPIFGEKTTMFALNKCLSKHIFNAKDVVEQKDSTGSIESSSDRKRSKISSHSGETDTGSD